MAEPIGPSGKDYGWSKFQKLASNKIDVSLNLRIPKFFFIKSAKFFLVFVIQLYKEKMFPTEIEDGHRSPWSDK